MAPFYDSRCVAEQRSSSQPEIFYVPFLPHGSKSKKDVERGKLISIYDHANPKKTCNPNIYSAYRFDDRVYNLLVYAKYYWNRLKQNKQFFVMRRDANPRGEGADGKGV